MPSPLPQIEALIEEHQLLKRIYRQRTGEDETAVIGELGEAISAVDVFSDIPVLMAKALAGGISLEGAGEALSIGAAGLFLRSLGGNPMDVHLHTSVNLRRYLLRLDGIRIILQDIGFAPPVGHQPDHEFDRKPRPPNGRFGGEHLGRECNSRSSAIVVATSFSVMRCTSLVCDALPEWPSAANAIWSAG
jgi:hypothetical protein